MVWNKYNKIYAQKAAERVKNAPQATADKAQTAAKSAAENPEIFRPVFMALGRWNFS